MNSSQPMSVHKSKSYFIFKVPPADYSQEITGTRTEQRVKMSRMRQRIAARLKEAQNTNAMLTTFNELDMRQVSFICVYMHKEFFFFYSLRYFV